MCYLLINGEQHGPYSLEQVQVMLASGQITPETMSWTEGLVEWQPVEQTLALPHTPPPVVAPARVAAPEIVRRSGKFTFFGVGMKFFVVSVIVLGILVLAGGFGMFAYLSYYGNGLDKSSKEYVDAAIPAIVTSWSPDELVKRESKGFQRATNDQQLVSLFTAFRRLGALKTYEGSKGEANINYTPPDGKTITATYVGSATFENGEAQIRVVLSQEEGAWKIQAFRIDSPVFGS